MVSVPKPVPGRAVAREADYAWSLTDVITRLRRVLRSSVRHEFPWESLPMAQVEILQRLVDDPGMGVSDLAIRQRLATNTVSNLVQTMVVAGLLTRSPHPDDRRAVNLTVTALGKAKLDGWQRANEQRLNDALSKLDPPLKESIDAALPALAELAAILERTDTAAD